MNRSIVRDLLTVLAGTAGAQLLGLLALPILARLYDPAAFGAYQFYLSLLIFMSIGAALRIELILLSCSPEALEREIDHLVGLTLIVSAAVTIVATATQLLTRWTGMPIGLLGIGLLGNGVIQIASLRLIRAKSFHRLAALKFVQVATYVAVALLISFGNTPDWGLIAADMTGRLAAGIMALWSLSKLQDGRWPRPTFAKLRRFVQRNWELPVFSLPGAFTNSAGAMMTPLLIFKVYGAAAAGQYALSDRSLGAPLAMIITAGSQVYSGQLVHHLANEGRHAVRSMFGRVVVGLLVIALLGASGVALVIPPAFAIAFGPGWVTAAQICQIMVFAYAITFVSGLANQTLVVLKAFKLQSFWDISRTSMIAIAWVAIFVWGLSLLDAIKVYAAIMAAMGLFYLVICFMKLRAPDGPVAEAKP